MKLCTGTGICSRFHSASKASEMAGLFQSYADGSAMEKISLNAAMVLPALLHQKPHLTSKTKDHINCIERRYRLWKEENFEALLEEGRVIQ